MSPSVGHFQPGGAADDVAAAVAYLHREADERFRAVHEHEVRADGAFLLSVRRDGERSGIGYARPRIRRLARKDVEHRGEVKTVGERNRKCFIVGSLLLCLAEEIFHVGSYQLVLRQRSHHVHFHLNIGVPSVAVLPQVERCSSIKAVAIRSAARIGVSAGYLLQVVRIVIEVVRRACRHVVRPYGEGVVQRMQFQMDGERDFRVSVLFGGLHYRHLPGCGLALPPRLDDEAAAVAVVGFRCSAACLIGSAVCIFLRDDFQRNKLQVERHLGFDLYQRGVNALFAVFRHAGKKDSALFYIQEAIKATPKSGDNYFNLLLRINRLDYYYAAYPDSIAGQLDECCRLLKDTADIDPLAQNYLYAYYGMALLRTPGHEQEGVGQLERSFRNFQTSRFPEGIISVGDELIRAYIRIGMPDRIPSIYSLYTGTSDSLRQQARVNAAIGANVRYETGRKEQENLVLAAEVSLKQRTLIFTWLLVGLLFVILLVGGIYMRQRQRFLRQVSNARLSQISGLLQAQQELKEKNESLLEMQEKLRQSNGALFEAKQELSRHNASLTQELHATSGRLDEVSSRLEAVSKQNVVSDLRMKISTEILCSDKEAEFRRSFTAFYPEYIPALHRLSPDITRTDELIAMLVILELSSDEIALTLGISRLGVNKARSRMRKRLGLARNANLEDFLKGIWA